MSHGEFNISESVLLFYTSSLNCFGVASLRTMTDQPLTAPEKS